MPLLAKAMQQQKHIWSKPAGKKTEIMLGEAQEQFHDYGRVGMQIGPGPMLASEDESLLPAFYVEFRPGDIPK